MRVAVDIGGTFTDLQILDQSCGRTFAHKTPTTPADPAEGMVRGVGEAGRRLGFAMHQIDSIMHGTTIATNAVLERRYPKAALITTRGFEDVLEIGRHVRREVYGQIAEPRPVLIPRRLRFGVSERVRADGRVERPLDESELEAICERLREQGVQVVAVCCLHSFTNPTHEQRIETLLRRQLPGARISLSSTVSPEAREYERTATTVLNALLMPVVGDYLDRLKDRLATAGVDCPVYLVQSNGGVTTPEIAAEQPARLLLSGPSGGARAVEVLAERLGVPDLIAIDMGGTSFDVSIIKDGRARLQTQGEVDGTPVRLPMLEIRTIGAGGGSLAEVDGGRLTVGPRSAGADPGPVAYGRGGHQPTVTDANLALGRVDPDYFLGGAFRLDAAAAKAALQRRVAGPLNLDADRAAAGIVAIAVSNMAGAIRLSLFEKGLDPKDFALVSFGGAGPLHAALVADELGARRVLYPPDAGTQSAWGMLFSDIVQDLSRSRLCRAEPTSLTELDALLAELYRQGEALLARAKVPAARRRFNLSFDMRYPGQGWEIGIEAGAAELNEKTLNQAAADFHRSHQRQFAHSDPAVTPEIVTVRLRAQGLLDKPQPADHRPQDGEPVKGRREVFLDNRRQAVEVIDRARLGADDVVAGPAIVEEPHATIVLPAGWRARLTLDVLSAEKFIS